jgi:hypothetical protein
MKTMHKVIVRDGTTTIEPRKVKKETPCYVFLESGLSEYKQNQDIFTRVSYLYFDDKKDAVKYAVAQAEKKITLHNAHIDSQRDSIAKILTEATKC